MMKKSIFCLLAVSLCFVSGPAAAQSGESGWISLFDGKSLSGWRASENKDTFSVRDGMIVVEGPRCGSKRSATESRLERSNWPWPI